MNTYSMTNFSSLWNKYKFLFMYNSNSTWTTSCSVTFCYCLSEAVKLWFPTGSNSQQEVIPSKSRTFPPPSVTRAVGLFSVFSRDGNFMNKMLGGFVHIILVHSEDQCLVCHCVGFGDSHLLPIEWLLV